MTVGSGDVNERSSGLLNAIAQLANKLDSNKSAVISIDSDKRFKSTLYLNFVFLLSKVIFHKLFKRYIFMKTIFKVELFLIFRNNL